MQVKLAKRTKGPPPPPRYDLHGLSPDLKEQYNDTLASLLEVSAEDSAPPDHSATFTVYTDGSGSKGRATAHTRAGWGWTARQREGWLDACGPVITSRDHNAYIGASVGSNNTGELSAIVEALLFASEHEYTHVQIYTDSQWAINVITGRWRARTNKVLVGSAQRLFRKSGMLIRFHWVKGHQGNEGNERADRLAEEGKVSTEAKGGRTMPYSVITDNTSKATDHTADSFVPAVKEAAKTTLPFRQHVPRTPWITDHTLQALAQARKAEAEQSDNWKELRNAAKRSAKRDRVQWVHRELLRDPSGTCSTVWNVVRRQKRGFQGRRAHLKENGQPQPWSRTHEIFRNHLQTPNGPSLKSPRPKSLKDNPDHNSTSRKRMKATSQSTIFGTRSLKSKEVKRQALMEF